MKRINQTSRWTAWAIALCMTSLMFGWIAVKMDVRFAINDDATILRVLMGYETGDPATFLPYSHGLLVWLLYPLHRLFPLIPWFSHAQLALLFLALTVIAKGLMQCFQKARKPLWMGAVLAGLFFFAFGIEYVTRMTFTCTSAMLSAAAAVQILSIDFRGSWKRSTIGAGILFALAYAMRLNNLLPCMAFCGLAFAFSAWEHLAAEPRSGLRPVWCALLICGVFIIGMVGLRYAETALQPVDRYLEWDEESAVALDFYSLRNVPPEALEQAGWDEHTLERAQNWFFLDGDVSTEAFRILNKAMEEQDTQTLGERMQIALRSIRGRLSKSAYAFRLMAIAVIAGAFSAVGALFQKGRRIRLLLMLSGIAGGFAVMLVYLALQGRLPLRAVSVIAMPSVALALGMLPVCVPEKRFAKPALCVLLAVMTVYTVVHALPVYRLSQRYPWTKRPGLAWTDLERYAAKHRDCLFIADNDLATDVLEPFPTYPEGLPMNISHWGGWDMRSPASEELFARFGLDVWDVDAEAFLRGDVFYATEHADEPPQLLLDWILTQTGKNVAYRVYDAHGRVSILQFYENGGKP